MGVTLYNKKYSINLSYKGFARLMQTIADLLNSEFGELYKKWSLSEIDNITTNELLRNLYKNEKLTDEDDFILEFLFASECTGTISAKACKVLYKLIKDYDDKIVYGYAGQPDCASFKNFKTIIETSAENKWIVRWE